MTTQEYQALLSEFRTLKSEEEIKAFKAKMTTNTKNQTSKENDLELSFFG